MDVMSDRYAGHIINEILPFVTETHNIHISQDPAKRCMCGQSSAAVASLYTCWHRPDKFGLALLTSTSFGNTIPGQLMPYVVRNTPKKNIKMYVHVGEEDAGSYDSLPPNKPCLAHGYCIIKSFVKVYIFKIMIIFSELEKVVDIHCDF